MNRRRRANLIGPGFLLIFLLLALAGTGRDPHAIDLAARLASPSWSHWLGTDNLGRDLFARVAVAAGRTLLVVAVVQSICIGAGIAAGLSTALAGDAAETVAMRVIQLAAALPRLVVALSLTSIFGLTPFAAALAIASTGWSRYALVVHALAHDIMKREHWRAALALGTHPRRAAIRHILPAISGPLRAFAGADAARIVVAFSSLAFLGLGADTGKPDWGGMIWEYRLFLFDAPRLPLVPLAAIVGLAVALHLTLDAPAGNRAEERGRSPANG